MIPIGFTCTRTRRGRFRGPPGGVTRGRLRRVGCGRSRGWRRWGHRSRRDELRRRRWRICGLRQGVLAGSLRFWVRESLVESRDDRRSRRVVSDGRVHDIGNLGPQLHLRLAHTRQDLRRQCGGFHAPRPRTQVDRRRHPCAVHRDAHSSTRAGRRRRHRGHPPLQFSVPPGLLLQICRVLRQILCGTARIKADHRHLPLPSNCQSDPTLSTKPTPRKLQSDPSVSSPGLDAPQIRSVPSSFHDAQQSSGSSQMRLPTSATTRQPLPAPTGPFEVGVQESHLIDDRLVAPNSSSRASAWSTGLDSRRFPYCKSPSVKPIVGAKPPRPTRRASPPDPRPKVRLPNAVPPCPRPRPANPIPSWRQPRGCLKSISIGIARGRCNAVVTHEYKAALPQEEHSLEPDGRAETIDRHGGAIVRFDRDERPTLCQPRNLVFVPPTRKNPLHRSALGEEVDQREGCAHGATPF